MGIGMFAVFCPSLEGDVFNSDGKLLAAQLPYLDSLCDQLGVSRLSAFTDRREPPPGFQFDVDADSDELEALMGEWNEWFSPAAAIPILEALVAALPEASAAALPPSEIEALRTDLAEILGSLRLAEAGGSTFRFDFF